MTLNDFNFNNASLKKVSDGCIDQIWLEDSEQTEIKDNCITLNDGSNALIEFTNGRKMIITNSEWSSMNFI